MTAVLPELVPGARHADKTQVALSAYNNATQRLNVFNQTDLIYVASTGRFGTRCWLVPRSAAS